MIISTTDARQGVNIENHRIAKVVVISTALSFLTLALLAAGF